MRWPGRRLRDKGGRAGRRGNLAHPDLWRVGGIRGRLREVGVCEMSAGSVSPALRSGYFAPPNVITAEAELLRRAGGVHTL